MVVYADSMYGPHGYMPIHTNGTCRYKAAGVRLAQVPCCSAETQHATGSSQEAKSAANHQVIKRLGCGRSSQRCMRPSKPTPAARGARHPSRGRTAGAPLRTLYDLPPARLRTVAAPSTLLGPLAPACARRAAAAPAMLHGPLPAYLRQSHRCGPCCIPALRVMQ